MSEDGSSAPGQSDGADEEQTRIGLPGGQPAPTPESLQSPSRQAIRPVSEWTDTTVDMPQEAFANLNQKAPPQRVATHPPRFAPPPEGRKPPLWTYVVTGLVVVAILVGMTYVIVGPPSHQPSGASDITGCEAGTPCQVANAYLAAYTGAKYDAMYGLISAGSRTRFNDPAILKAAANYQVNSITYTDAKDYIFSRTKGILSRAQVYGLSATLGKVKKASATHVTFPTRIIMKSTYLGDVVLDVTLPLTLEKGAWRVDWSPGLILPQLDDPADPQYTRLVRFTPMSGKRGTIFSSDGQVLAQDGAVDVVGIVPNNMTNASAVTQALVSHLDLTTAEVTAAYQGKDGSQFWPVRTISPFLYGQVIGGLQVPGISVQQGTGRYYPMGSVMEPITGYIGQVGPSEISSDASHYYQSGDVIGRAGVEKWGEGYLRPTKGGSLVIRSRNGDGSDGDVVVTIANRAPVDGESIYTTVDVATQTAAMAKLANQNGHTGGAVALAPSTGAVLSMATYPAYDPNDFSLGFTANEQARFNAMSSPYINRATMAADPVGSIFKLITLSAALENGIPGSTVFTCTGTYQVPGEDHLRYDDAHLGHGAITAVHAIAPSCDVVFWTIAVTLNQKDPNILPGVAKKFGFGSASGIIGLPADEDNPGVVPDPQWLKTNKNAGWSPSDAANLGIGQGFFQATPLQIASLSASLANNGVRETPTLISKIVDSTGTTTESLTPKSPGKLPLSADNLQVVQTAMLGPTNASDGTAAVDFTTYPVTVAGKTGTAESGQPAPHAWFTCYAPAPKLSGAAVTPQIAVGVLVEYSSFGEMYAVPIAKTIMSTYLHLSQ